MTEAFKITAGFVPETAKYFGTKSCEFWVNQSSSWGDCGTRAYYLPRVAPRYLHERHSNVKAVKLAGLSVLCSLLQVQGVSVGKAVFTYPDNGLFRPPLDKLTGKLKDGGEFPERVAASLNPRQYSNYTAICVEVAAAVLPPSLSMSLPTARNSGMGRESLPRITKGKLAPSFYVTCITFTRDDLEAGIKRLLGGMSVHTMDASLRNNGW